MSMCACIQYVHTVHVVSSRDANLRADRCALPHWHHALVAACMPLFRTLPLRSLCEGFVCIVHILDSY